jgi:iron(III) transport system substrate-binding protein
MSGACLSEQVLPHEVLNQPEEKMKPLGRIALIATLLVVLAACAAPAPTPVPPPPPTAVPAVATAAPVAVAPTPVPATTAPTAPPPTAVPPTATSAPKPTTAPAAALDPDVDKWLKAAELGPYAPAKQDWAAIEAAAKKEGKVVVYATTSKVADIKPLFEKKYPGITVEAPDIGGDEVLLKTKEEQKAKAFYGDVWYSSSSSGDVIGDLLPKQYLWNFVPDALVSVTPDSARNPLLIVKYGVKVMAYNSELNKTCPINNIWDLTDAAWKGKMFIEDPLNDASQMGMLVTIANHTKELTAAYKAKYGKDPVLDADTPDVGWLWLKNFAKNKPVPEPGGDEEMAAFAAPKMKDSYLGINVGYSKYSDVLKGKLFFEPCKGLNPIFGLQSASYMAVINRAQHPNAAKLFINYISNVPEGFAPWNTMGSYSPRSDWEPAKGAIPYKEVAPQLWPVDEDFVYKNINKYRDFYALTLLK